MEVEVGSSTTSVSSDSIEQQSDSSSSSSRSRAGFGSELSSSLPIWKRRPGKPLWLDQPAEDDDATTSSTKSTAESQQAQLEFSVRLSKCADGLEKIGLSTESLAGEFGGIMVRAVNDGLVAQWNLWNPRKVVRPGDRIVEVNGQRGDADLLCALVGFDDRLKLVIQRDLMSL